ncbi:MAG: hypothetical protein Q8P41_17700 [Pseudomonadota bacterium]|nr:hypothetical protein [Pseudomonadota bacterium]
MHPGLPDLPSIYAAGPLAPRIVAGAAGLVLLLAGSRLYWIAVVLPGLLLGLGGGVLIAHLLGLAPMVTVGVAVVGGLVGALVARAVERLAIAIAGVIAGLGAAQLGWPLAAATAPPWWIWPLAAVAGAVLFPFVWRAALVPLTAFIGAVVLVDVAGVVADPLVVGGLTAVGIVVQLALGRGPQKKERDEKE